MPMDLRSFGWNSSKPAGSQLRLLTLAVVAPADEQISFAGSTYGTPTSDLPGDPRNLPWNWSGAICRIPENYWAAYPREFSRPAFDNHDMNRFFFLPRRDPFPPGAAEHSTSCQSAFVRHGSEQEPHSGNRSTSNDALLGARGYQLGQQDERKREGEEMAAFRRENFC